MKNYYAAELNTGTSFDDFFMLKACAVKEGSNHKLFIDMTLGDGSGDVNGKKWDASEEEIAEIESYEDNSIIKVRAAVNEWQGKKQLKISRFRKATKDDGIIIGDFIKTAPENGEDMYDYIMSRALTVEDEDLKKVCTTVLERNKQKLLYYPAASKNHHSYMSGLLYHVKRMLMAGEKLCEVYPLLRRDWVITGVIIHDIEKLNEIISNEWGISPGYTVEGMLLGHIVQGAVYMDRLGRELNIDTEKITLLQHMIVSHHYEPEYGSPKRPMFPEAELLHYLDIFDARIFDMEDALSQTSPGEFSEKVWTLENRRIYRTKC